MPRSRPFQTRRKLLARKDWIAHRHLEDGIPVTRLAKELGTDAQTLRTFMRAEAIPTRCREAAAALRHQAHRDLRAPLNVEIVRLRTEEGRQISEIVETLGVTEKIVYAALSAAGVTKKLRPAGQPVPAKAPRGMAKLDALRPEVDAAISEGLSGAELARRFEVAENSVFSWLKSRVISLTPMTTLQRRIVQLWDNSDLNMNGISVTLDCGRTTVANALRRAGRLAPDARRGRPPGSTGTKRSLVHSQRAALCRDAAPTP
jgi:transposase-like protein